MYIYIHVYTRMHMHVNTCVFGLVDGLANRMRALLALQQACVYVMLHCNKHVCMLCCIATNMCVCYVALQQTCVYVMLHCNKHVCMCMVCTATSIHAGLCCTKASIYEYVLLQQACLCCTATGMSMLHCNRHVYVALQQACLCCTSMYVYVTMT